MIDVKDHGAVGDGVTDDGPAIQAAINTALGLNPTTAVSGRPTTKPAAVHFPPGVYYIRTGVAAEINPGDRANVDKVRLTLLGEAAGSVFLVFDEHTDPVALDFYRGFITLEDLHLDGRGRYPGVMLQMGRAGRSDYIQQFQINRVNFSSPAPGGTCIRAGWAFDGTVTDALFVGLTGAVGIDFPAQDADNCNNWAFRRCHFENAMGGTFIRARSLLGPSNYHTQFSFDQCHWESRAYNTRLLDLEGCSRWTFMSCQFTHSNSPTGDHVGVTHADAVNALRLVNCNSFQWIGGSVSRQGTPPKSWPRKPLALGGTVRAIQFQGTYFFLNTSSGMGVAGLRDVWESDETTPLSGKRGAGAIKAPGCMINSFTRTEMFDDLSGWSDPSSTNVWTARFEPTTKSLVYGYGADGEDVRDARVDRMSLGKDGGLNALYYTAEQAKIPAGANHVFNTAFESNPNRRGIYLVYANDGAGSYALVFNSGASLDVIAVGGKFSVGDEDPESAGKYNMFVDDTRISVTNRRGSERDVAVVPFGLRI